MENIIDNQALPMHYRDIIKDLLVHMSTFVQGHQVELNTMMDDQEKALSSVTLFQMLEACGAHAIQRHHDVKQRIPNNVLRKIGPIAMQDRDLKNVYKLQVVNKEFRNVVYDARKHDPEFQGKEQLFKELKMRALVRIVDLAHTPSRSFKTTLDLWPSGSDMTPVVIASIRNIYTYSFFNVFATQTRIEYDTVQVMSTAILTIMKNNFRPIEGLSEKDIRKQRIVFNELASIIKHIFDSKTNDIGGIYNFLSTHHRFAFFGTASDALFSNIVHWLIDRIYKRSMINVSEYHADMTSFILYLVDVFGRQDKPLYDVPILKHDLIYVIQHVHNGGASPMTIDDNSDFRVIKAHIATCKQSIQGIDHPLIAPLDHILDTLSKLTDAYI